MKIVVMVLSLVANFVLVAALVFGGVNYVQLVQEHDYNTEELDILRGENELLIMDKRQLTADIENVEDNLNSALQELAELRK